MRTKNRTDKPRSEAKRVLRGKRGRLRRSAKQRQELIEAYRASGLRQAMFCRREGIHPTTLNHWLRGRVRPVRAPSPRARRKKACGFAQVEVALAGPAPVEIELGAGLLIRVRDVNRLKDLTEFIRQMQGTPEASPC